MEPILSSETSAIKSQTPGNYPKRNKLHLQHGESLKRRLIRIIHFMETVTTLNQGEQQYLRAMKRRIGFVSSLAAIAF